MIHFAMVGCDQERPPPPKHEEGHRAPQTAWEAPEEPTKLVTPELPRTLLRLEGTHRFPECWEFLESDGAPVNPLIVGDQFAQQLSSCDVEGRGGLQDGSLVLAWGTKPQEGSRARDLRLAVWDGSGKLRWTHTLNRGKQAPNWVANFRRSFVTPLPPRHVCYGTLWEGDTQVACLDYETGEENWKGSLPFWSGIVPVAGKDGLIVADLSALTERYPFTGGEMRHRKLEGLGGRAGYYATDGRRLYFAPSRTETPPLIAYDLSNFKEVWRVPLHTNPAPSLSLVLDDVDRLLLKLDDTLHALDTETGERVWSYEIGDDIPSFASHDGALYILARRPEQPNQLVKLDPATGERSWVAPTPAGTLRVEAMEGVLLLGSVRAVQRIAGADTPDEGVGGE